MYTDTVAQYTSCILCPLLSRIDQLISSLFNMKVTSKQPREE